ncbi:MAG: hypothetical protein ACAI44_20275 [Candidatus Sericytochromatia bacterium]
MLDYEYLEPQTTRAGDNPAYHLAGDLQRWIGKELEKRRAALQPAHEQEVLIRLTMRTFRKYPVFVLGLRNPEGVMVLEAWYFHMVKPEGVSGGLQLTLDRVSLRQLFPETSPNPTPNAAPNPNAARPNTPRPNAVRPIPKPQNRPGQKPGHKPGQK